MSYIDPSKVTSPQVHVSNLRPVIDRGAWNWSAALLDWDGSLAVALRWNGGQASEGKPPHPGNPQSRGLPTWFVVPDELAVPVLHTLVQCGLGGGAIDANQASEWVKEALQKLDGPDIRSEEFAQRVKKIVRTMREVGEI